MGIYKGIMRVYRILPQQWRIKWNQMEITGENNMETGVRKEFTGIFGNGPFLGGYEKMRTALLRSPCLWKLP